MTVKKYHELTLESGEGDDVVYCKCHIRDTEEDEEVEAQMEIAISGGFEPTAFTVSQLPNLIEVLQEAQAFLNTAIK